MNFSFTVSRGNFSSVLTARKFGMIPRIRFVCCPSALEGEDCAEGCAAEPG